ncbi:MAG: GntR family transcriptional regulator, partial [Chloroflexota bacterium]
MLDRQSLVPIHYQFKKMLLDQILSGHLPPGTQLPTEGEYARRFGVSLAPIRQALGDLAQQGYIERRTRRGTFVRQRKIAQKIASLSSFTDAMHETNLPVAVEVLRLELLRAPKDRAAMLGLPESEPVVFLERRCSLDREPAALLRSWLPATRFPDLESRILADRSLYHLLENEYDCLMRRAESYFEVCPATHETSALLAIGPGLSVIRVESVTYDQHDRAVEYVEI